MLRAVDSPPPPADKQLFVTDPAESLGSIWTGALQNRVKQDL